MKYLSIQFFITFVLTSLFTMPALGSGGVKSTFYHVDGNKVDERTFLGWSLFHSTCVGCHGTGASGTSMAPDLTASVQQMSPVAFENKVLQRYMISLPQDEVTGDDQTALRMALIDEIRKEEARQSGETPSMPEWKNSPVVKERVGNLYRYLKARADGVLGPDRPELLKE
ncbi:MAG: cytochrome c [Gammaproteobacteria bacterium]